MKIRVETIDYFLRRYRDDIISRGHEEREIESTLARYEQELRLSLSGINRSEPARELIQIAC